MRLIFLLAILLSSYLVGKTQELKTKKQQDQVFTEIFQFDKKSKLKQGAYLKIQHQSNDTVAKGQYLNDVKSGIWAYFDTGKQLYMKYDHTSDSCLWVSELASKPDTFPVRGRNNFGFAELNRPPLYIGFRKELEVRFASSLRVPIPVMEKEESIVCMATFVVTKEGNIDEIQTEKIENKQFRDQVLELLKGFDGKWLPGIYNGNKVDTKLYMVFDIGPVTFKPPLVKKPYIINISLKYYGIVRTTRVVTNKTNYPPSSNLFRNIPPGGSTIRGF